MKKLLAAIIFALILGTPVTAWAGDHNANRDYAWTTDYSDEKTVIMIVANRISVQDLIDSPLPSIKNSLRDRAGIGLMNIRAAKGTQNAASAYLSIGSGARALAGNHGRLAIERGDPLIINGFKQPLTLPGRGLIVTPAYPDISRQNAKLNYPVSPGALGEALGRNRVRRSVLGNADSAGFEHREINLITMNGKGGTEWGDVTEPINDPDAALAAIEYELKGSLRSSRKSFIALEYGPAGTIDGRRQFLSDRAVEEAKKTAMAEIDLIYGGLLKNTNPKTTMIIIVSPEAPVTAASANKFRTPVIIAATGHRGLLTSRSTRWDGLITNGDIAPTILTWLATPVPELLPGRNITSIAEEEPLAVLGRMEDRVLANYSARGTLLSPFITATIALIILAGIAVLLRRGDERLSYLQPLLLALMFMPVVILLSNIPARQIPGVPTIVVPIASLTLGSITWYLFRASPRLAAVLPALATVPVILGQLPLDSILERDSVLGMSSIIGARFYGIGNEYVGILLGATAIAITALLSRAKWGAPARASVATLFFIALAVLIGLPTLGANVGGTLATVAAAGLIFLTLRDVKISAKHVAIISAGMGLAVAGILVADYLTQSSSHAGQAVSVAANGNLGQIWVIIARKLGNNVRLVTRTSWTNILLAAIVVAGLLKYSARDLWDKVRDENSELAAGCRALGLASIAGLAFNDSGVVTAAFMVVFAISTWLYLMIDAAIAATATADLKAGTTISRLLAR